MAIIVYLTIYTGALVRHTKSSLAYGAWPIPFDDIVPHNAHDWVQFRTEVWRSSLLSGL